MSNLASREILVSKGYRYYYYYRQDIVSDNPNV
jgi:hypothetical protein